LFDKQTSSFGSRLETWKQKL